MRWKPSRSAVAVTLSLVCLVTAGSTSVFMPIAMAQNSPDAAASPSSQPASPPGPNPTGPNPTGITGTADPSTGPGSSPEPTAANPVAPQGATEGIDPLANPFADPLAESGEGLSGGAYSGQAAFSQASRAVSAPLLSAATDRLSTAQTTYQTAETTLSAAIDAHTRAATRIDQLGRDRQADLAAAVEARENMRRRAVSAYVRGDQKIQLLATLGNPAEYSRANRYLEALADQDRSAERAYKAAVARLNQEERELVETQVDANERRRVAEDELTTARTELANASMCQRAFTAASHVCPDGFIFPVPGEVNFIDSWGFARQTGNANAHWHEGTDIMAPGGREVVAVEAGTLRKVGGDGGLGGLRLWLDGVSGTSYYYAHFSGYSPAALEGAVVEPGTVLGYVGNTGAPGSATHLHFEIHPAGGAPVNPFPLLRTVWGDRPMRSESAVAAAIAAVAAVPEEER